MKKVVTFGEIMLRFAPEGYNRLFQTPVLNGTFGGGEANVAVSLANYGFDVHYDAGQRTVIITRDKQKQVNPLVNLVMHIYSIQEFQCSPFQSELLVVVQDQYN